MLFSLHSSKIKLNRGTNPERDDGGSGPREVHYLEFGTVAVVLDAQLSRTPRSKGGKPAKSDITGREGGWPLRNLIPFF